ncbi:MAG: SAM-dependent methyltransferase, partial [Chitinophagaceae bacterium]
ELGAKGNVEKIRKKLKYVLKKHGFEKQSMISNWYFPSVGEYANKLEQYGFEIRFIESFDRPTPLKSNGNGIVDWLEMFGGAFFQNIDDQEKIKILYEVQENLRDDLYKEGTWMADYKRLRFLAYKKE